VLFFTKKKEYEAKRQSTARPRLSLDQGEGHSLVLRTYLCTACAAGENFPLHEEHSYACFGAVEYKQP
jgi:hypothetical protein